MNRQGILILLGLIAVAMTIDAQKVKYVDLKGNIRINYDVQKESYALQDVTLNMDNGTMELNYYLSFDPQTSLRVVSNGGEELIYRIFDNPTEPRQELFSIQSAASPEEAFAGVFPAPEKPNKGPTVTRSIALVLPPGGFAQAGTYTGEITISLYTGSFASGTYMGQNTIDISVIVGEIIDIAVVPNGMPFDYAAKNINMDFGYLEADSLRSLDIVARANTSYGVSLTSSNGGIMKNADTQDNSVIPYELSIDGSPLSLTAGTSISIASGAPSTTSDGTRYRMDAKILPFDFPTEGEYSDILTVTISKN